MKRWEWLAGLVNEKRYRRGVELGVKDGQTLFYLLRHCPGLAMIGVDIWSPQPDQGAWGYTAWNHEDHEWTARNRAEKYPGRVWLLKMLTTEAAEYIEPQSTDFVFVDACHATEAVKADIEAWLPKIRRGGLLCGHDAGKPTVRAALNGLIPGWKHVPHDNCWMIESL